jgi:dihydrofolate reductase
MKPGPGGAAPRRDAMRKIVAGLFVSLDGVVDELRLLLFPVVVGTGRHLFEDWTDALPMTLLRSRRFANGVVSLNYEPTAPPEGCG